MKVLRGWVLDVEVRRAAAEGARFLLVCYDVMDRARGDEDLGYYYPVCRTVDEARSRFATLQLGLERTTADVCEAIVDLLVAGNRPFDPAPALEPRLQAACAGCHIVAGCPAFNHGRQADHALDLIRTT